MSSPALTFAEIGSMSGSMLKKSAGNSKSAKSGTVRSKN